jgi:hypothetical protein
MIAFKLSFERCVTTGWVWLDLRHAGLKPNRLQLQYHSYSITGMVRFVLTFLKELLLYYRYKFLCYFAALLI